MKKKTINSNDSGLENTAALFSCDLENFVITAQDEEAIRDAVENRMRRPASHQQTVREISD